jgi:hypothetical protein
MDRRLCELLGVEDAAQELVGCSIVRVRRELDLQDARGIVRTALVQRRSCLVGIGKRWTLGGEE